MPLCCMKTILWGQLKSAVRCREETGSPQRREEEGRRGKGLWKEQGGKQDRAGTGSKGRRREGEEAGTIGSRLVVGLSDLRGLFQPL